MKPALFVDFDGTLCHDRFWRSLQPDEYVRVQESIFEGNPLTEEWMRGKRTGEEMTRYLAEETGLAYDYLWETFVRDAETMHVPPALLERVGALRDRYVTVLATVNMDCFDRFTVPALGLDRTFDVILNSYADGRFKQEEGGALFVDAASRLNAPLESFILIDDRAGTCAVFEALGGTAYCTTGTEDTLAILERIETAA